MITVKLFAILKEKAGSGELRLPPGPATAGELLREISRRYPALADAVSRGRLLISVNGELAKQDDRVRDGDEVGLMPPFSGGGEQHGIASVQTERFSLDAEIGRIKRTSVSIGGIVTFLGTVRDLSRGKRVAQLDFEHYPGMAEKRLREIRDRAIAEFGAIDATIIHRVGRILPGEDIVLVIVAAGHRDEAFRACRFCIDELKRLAPIWKKESSDDGSVWVEEHP